MVAELKFQAQVDAEYQRHGLSLQQYPKNVLMSSDLRSNMAVLSKAQHRYKKRKRNRSASEQKREKREEEAAMKLGEVNKIYPQCNTCKYMYHFKSEVFLK